MGGTPNSWMVFQPENPKIKWMIWGYIPPILGDLRMMAESKLQRK